MCLYSDRDSSDRCGDGERERGRNIERYSDSVGEKRQVLKEFLVFTCVNIFFYIVKNKFMNYVCHRHIERGLSYQTAVHSRL